MKNIKFYPITGIVLFLILTITGALCIRGNVTTVVESQYEAVSLEDYLVAAYGYDVDENSYVIEDVDPQLLLQCANDNASKAYSVKIQLEQEVDLSNVQAFYGREEMAFTEADQHSFPDGKTDTIEVFSPEQFQYLRLDINEDFELKNIQVAYDVKVTQEGNMMDYVIMLLVNLVLAALLALVPVLDSWIKGIYGKGKALGKGAVANRKKLLIDIIVTLILFGVSFAIEMAFVAVKNAEYINKFRFLVIFGGCLILYFTIRYRKRILEHTSIYLFVLLMAVGSINVVSAPPSGGISWDDEIHYGKTAYLSYGADGELSYCDYRLVHQYADVIFSRSTYQHENRDNWSGKLNLIQETMPTQIETNDYRVAVEYVAYIPAAIALAMGRGLGLSFTHTFMFGKLMNLFCYALLMSIAVSLLKKRGKLIASFLALIPTSLFIASAYAYDWWVIGFIVLGYAMLYHELEEKQQISWKKFIAIMVVMILGILPKAIYFPLILPMMLLRKKCYSHSKVCRGVALVSMGVLVGSFLMPMLASNANIGDVTRANPGVDSAKQIQFILTKPLEYTKILLTYLEGYLSPDGAGEYLTNFGYYGKFSYFTLCMLVIGVGCVLDNREINKEVLTGKLFKASVYICAFGSIVLAVTALYISFTPVAHETILGCQARYILPVLFPVLYSVSELNMKVSKKILNGMLVIGSVILAMIFLYGIYSLGICVY